MNVEIDALMLRRLKQLCHPDKHTGSDMSVLVMKWLNALATPAVTPASPFGTSDDAVRRARDIHEAMRQRQDAARNQAARTWASNQASGMGGQQSGNFTNNGTYNQQANSGRANHDYMSEMIRQQREAIDRDMAELREQQRRASMGLNEQWVEDLKDKDVKF